MNKTFFILLIFLLSTRLFGQMRNNKVYTGIGLTSGSLNASQSITSGISFFIGRNVFENPNSSISVCSNLKVGTEDRTGLAFYAFLPIAIVDGIAGNDVWTYGPNVHTFAEIPIILHYNFGFGANQDADDRFNFGFYIGFGINYSFTGYNDKTGKSYQISFPAYTTDLGIRFRGGLDLNLSASLSMNRPTEQISKPQLFGFTISKHISHY